MTVAERIAEKNAVCSDSGFGPEWHEHNVIAAINEALEEAAKAVETFTPPGEKPIVCSRSQLVDVIRALKG